MAVEPAFLVDKSAWEQARYDSRASARVAELDTAGTVAYCIVSLAEMLYSGRNQAELALIEASMTSHRFLPMTSAAEAQVGASMQALARRGQHRLPIPDLLLAAIAHAHDAVVLHYDSDFERIAAATGQRHEWIVPRGTGHRRGD